MSGIIDVGVKAAVAGICRHKHELVGRGHGMRRLQNTRAFLAPAGHGRGVKFAATGVVPGMSSEQIKALANKKFTTHRE